MSHREQATPAEGAGMSAPPGPDLDRSVSFFVPSLEGGGAERVMVLLANGLARRGLTAELVVLRSEGAYRSEVDPRVRIVTLGARRVATSVWSLARYLEARQPHVLVSAMNFANVAAVAAGLLTIKRPRLVLTEHSNLSRSLVEMRRPVALVLPTLMRATYPRAALILAASDGVAADLSRHLRLPPERVQTLHNPIDLARVRALSEVPLEHPWFRDGEPPVLLSVGRLTPAKDHPTLLDAFDRLRRRKRARLVLLGDGPDRRTLERRIDASAYKEDIHLVGFDLNPHRWMRSASALVLSSKREGFGNVLVDAMACGVPIVSTDCESGPSEILEGGRWGRLVPVGDPDALATALEQVLADDDSPDVTARAAVFDVPVVVERFLALLALAEVPR